MISRGTPARGAGKVLALATSALVLVSGCGFTGVSGLPLPGLSLIHI